MLFDFKREQELSFWMKNTFVSLDMIFIRADGRILRIAENTEPLSERLVPSGGCTTPRRTGSAAGSATTASRSNAALRCATTSSVTSRAGSRNRLSPNHLHAAMATPTQMAVAATIRRRRRIYQLNGPCTSRATSAPRTE